MDLTYYFNKHKDIHVIKPPHLRNPESTDQKPKLEPRLVDLEERNFSFGSIWCITLDTDSLRGKSIATLPIDSFLPSTEKYVKIWKHIRTGISAKVSMVADTDALIIDLRHNYGGDPNTVAFILSYLLDKGPRNLLDFVDRAGAVKHSFSTLPLHELPEGARVLGGIKPLFVLTTENIYLVVKIWHTFTGIQESNCCCR
jgi:hypothetical protein